LNPDLHGKRIAALDFGLARIGMAVCDELHISVNTRPVVDNDDRMWEELMARLQADRVDVVLVGVPRRVDETSSPIIEHIERFIAELRQRTARTVIEVDESFSTKRAHELMRVTGVKKKRRATKGTKDAMAAAIILQDFLDEHR
jgi:putative Holliday junction resolvase